MDWPAIVATVSLLVVQAGLGGMCLYAYSRMRTHSDLRAREDMEQRVRVESAVQAADMARRAVETIEVEHFRSLRALVEGLAAELGTTKGRMGAFAEEVDILKTKMSSEERIARRDARRREMEAAELKKRARMPSQPEDDKDEPDELDDLLHRSGIPLKEQAPAPAPGPAQRNHFGRIAR